MITTIKAGSAYHVTGAATTGAPDADSWLQRSA
jgi:hypothetical protein